MSLQKEEKPSKIIKNSNHEFTSKSFPTELILEMLLRLPVESLLRCKSVCKLWFSLISDSHFVKSHLKLSTTNNNQYLYHKLATISNSRLKTCYLNDVLLDKSVMNVVHHAYPWSHDIYSMIVGCCNGLLCIVDDLHTAFIGNPSTKMWNRLPSSGFENQTTVVYGFGYDDLTDDYKVVGISVARKSQTKMFSLKCGKWKNIDGVPDGIQLYCAYAVFFNGSIHWPAQNSKSSSDFALLSFDLVKETYGQVATPVYDYVDDDESLGVLGGLLSVVCSYRGNRADVWVMKVYGVKDSWTKLVSIPYPTGQPTLTGIITVPLCISNDGKVLLHLENILAVYDSKNKCFSEIQNFGACDDVCTFVESLVSPSTVAGLADNNDNEQCCKTRTRNRNRP